MPSQSRIAINSAATQSSRSSSPSRRHHDHHHESEMIDGEGSMGIDERVETQPESDFQVVELSDKKKEEVARAETKAGRPPVTTNASTTSSSSRQKFQDAVRKTTNARRALASSWEDHSREPGIDPKRVELPHLKAEVVLQSCDFSKEDADFNVWSNSSPEELSTFLNYLSSPRPSWSKVRWIHANGLSWDLIKPIALQYDLHPLSLEDMLHHGAESSSRSKVDYFKQHLFVNVVVHKTLNSTDREDDLGSIEGEGGKKDDGSKGSKGSHLREQFGFYRDHHDEETSIQSSTTSLIPTNTSTAPPNTVGYKKALKKTFTRFGTRSVEGETRSLNNHGSGLSERIRHRLYHKPARRASREAARCTVTTLTKDIKVHIHVENLSIFLLRSGVILTFTQDTGYHSRFSAIFDRIGTTGDLIRESEDPSFVLQALLDVVGDHALDIVDDFRGQLTRLEARVLASPDMGDVRHLHILSAQLLLLKSTLSPFLQLLQGIRMSDDAKAAAAIKPSGEQPQAPGAKKMGFVSHEAKVYLGDIMDHVESVLSALDLFASLAENLISYTFNNLSYSSNSYMQALSVLSVIFLPLTFLSGYFGMNFASFSAVLNGDVTYFWKIAIPVCVVTTIIFSFSYIKEMLLALKRQITRLRHQYEQGKEKIQ